jgi:hypothetical protein
MSAIDDARASATALRRALLAGWTSEEIALAETIRAATYARDTRYPQATQIDHPENLRLARWALAHGGASAALERVAAWTPREWVSGPTPPPKGQHGPGK